MGRARFDELYAQLLAHRMQPQVSLRSDPRAYNDCPAFCEIIKSPTFLPFIVEKLAGGDFFLNQAMEAMTTIDIPFSPGMSEQARAELWLRWWNSETRL